MYKQVLKKLDGQAEWIQIDKPALVLELSEEEQTAYARLSKAVSKSKLLLTTYFDSLRGNTALACSLGAAGVHVDLVRALDQLDAGLDALKPEQTLSLGVVNGRNVWRVGADKALGPSGGPQVPAHARPLVHD